MMNRQLSRSTVTLVVTVVIAMGLLVGLIVGRWLSLLGLTGLEVLEVDQESRGTLAAEEGLALRLLIGMGIGSVSAVASDNPEWSTLIIGNGPPLTASA